MADYIKRITETYPALTVTDGQAQDDWTPTVTATDWGRLKVDVNSVDYTFWRDTHTTVEDFQSTDPFGDATALIHFPQATIFDDIRALMPPGADVDIWRVHTDDTTLTLLWAGTIVGYQDRTVGTAIECLGSFYDLDRFLAVPDFGTADGLGTQDTGAHIVTRVNRIIADYTVNLTPMAATTTGIVQRNPGAFEPLVTKWLTELLGKAEVATTPGDAPIQWTIDCQNRTPILQVRDRTTVTATWQAGARGVECKLSDDYLAVPSAIFGEGVADDNCKWRNTKWPNLRIEPAPSWPGGGSGAGGAFQAGDGPNATTRLIKRELAEHGFGSGLSAQGAAFASTDFVDGPIGWFKIASGNLFYGDVFGAWQTFDSNDWDALFQNHGSATIGGPFYLPIWQDTRTQRFHYDARGVQLGENTTDYDPALPRIEHFVDYGKSNKSTAATEARRKVELYGEGNLTGRITVTTDPAETGLSRFSVRAGDNIALDDYRGTDRVLHVAKAVHQPDRMVSEFTVDEAARDYLSLQAIAERDERAKEDPGARIRVAMSTSRIREDRMPLWDCEAGSGVIPLHHCVFGRFTVIKFPAAQFGTIAAVELETVQADGVTADPTVFAAAIWGREVTPDQVLVAATDGTGSVNNIDWNGILPEWPVPPYGDTRLVYAAGRSTSALGWWPNEIGDHNDPADQPNITGVYKDFGSWVFETADSPWLWLSVLTLKDTYIQGRLKLADTRLDG